MLNPDDERLNLVLYDRCADKAISIERLYNRIKPFELLNSVV